VSRENLGKEREENNMVTETTHLRAVFHREIQGVRNAINNKLYKPNEVVDNALQRGLGACHLAEIVGIPYFEIELLYEEYRETLEYMRNEYKHK
jgi:hypothetical protein